MALRTGLLITAIITLGVAVPSAGFAQTPQISNGTPPESFLGEPFCFDAQFSNAGAPGYGPYMQLVIPADLGFDSADIFGGSALITDVGTFPAAPGNQLTDPVSGLPVTGPAGGTLTIIKLPVGSVVTGGPDLITEICLTIEPSAVAGTPLDVTLVPAYEFGDTATGDNGPIIGAANTQPVVPIIIRFRKGNGAPEGERPPSTTWPITYTLTADIANTVTVTNLAFRDLIPGDIQFVGPVSIVGGVGCSATTTPSTVTPGGTLEVDCSSATGSTGDADVTVSYPAYVTDILDETTCDTVERINNATLDVDYLATPQTQLADNSGVTVKHVALQKGAAPGGVVPGDTITYSLDFQVSDSADVNALVVTDTLPDGTLFNAHGALVVAGSPVAIVPSVTLNADGTTTVVYDIGAVAPLIAAGSAISLGYTADVQANYIDTGLPVLASDSLNNTVNSVYDLVQGASACNEGSAAGVGVVPVSLTKTIANPQPFYVPGETVTFRLNMRIPSGDTTNLQFSDALPLPVFKVADISTVFGVDIRLGPNDNLGLTPTNITADVPTNSIIIDWPNVSETILDPVRVLEVDIDAVVTDDPFADGLFLTNIAQSESDNTPGNTTTLVSPVQLLVGAPDLVTTKGVSASTNPNSTIAPPPATLPVDGDITNSDAQDVLTFVLTVENIGSAAAFDVLVSDTVPAGLTGCSLVSVTDGNGSALATTGDLFGAGLGITAGLTANDGNPAGGGAPYGTDTALVTFDCAIGGSAQPQQVIDNSAGAVWASQPGAAPFPQATDNATVTIANASASKLFVATSEATTSDAASPPRATIGEIVRYRLVAELPEGTIGDLNMTDLLPVGLTFLDDGSAKAAFISNGAGLNASNVPGLPTIAGNDAALAAVPSASVVFVLPPAAVTGGPFGDGTDPTFAFGTVTNSDSDADAEFLVVEFNALVDNTAAGDNDAGENRNNSFQILNGAAVLDASGSVQVRIAEPQVSVDKTASPTAGDAGDSITFTVVAANASGSNVSSAYDVELSDTLPSGLINLSVSSITPLSCPGLGALDSSTAAMLDISFADMAPGCSVTVVYTAELGAGVAPGTSVTNTANTTWTSLPGANGTLVNPTGSATPGVSGSDTGERDGSGPPRNTYSQSDGATVSVQSVSLSKAVVGTSQVSTGSSQGNPALDDLTIGETVDFEIVATIPEGTTPQVVISDTMPFTNGVMEMLSASIVSVGANLTPSLAPPSPAVLVDAQLSDGINDSASFDFGQVVNTADGVSDAADQIRIGVTGRLRDLPANVSGDLLTNTALVQFGPGLNASANAQVDVVAPALVVVKTGDITQGDAGDTVTFSLSIDHTVASTADAFDVLLSDTLPAGLTLVAGSLALDSGLAPDTLNEVGNGIQVTWASIGLAESAVITFQATIDTTVMPTEVLTNTASVGWSSLPGGDLNARMGSAGDSHGITITAPGLVKVITGTSEADTGAGQFGPETDLTVGEQVTYQFTVVIPEGTSSGATATDQLPTGSSVLQVVSSRIVSIGANISGPGLPAEGSAGTASDSNADTFNDRVVWNLGDLQNAPDGATTAADELVFEVVAVVLDQAANQSGVVTQTNTATFATASSSASGTVDVDLVAPEVTLDKTVTSPAGGFVDAGDTVSHLLTLDHTALSTADAYNLVVTDTLPSPGLQWVNDATVGGSCPGLSVDSSGAPVIVFTIPQLALATDSCTISYDTLVENSVQPSQTLANSAVMDYDSTPVFVAGQTRRSMDSGTAEVTVLAPTLVKVTTVSNVADTGMSQGDPALPDLAIGETITYELTVVVPEGTVNNAVVTDLMPVAPPGMGFLEAIGASVTAVGGNISTSLPGTPVLDDFQVVDGLDDRVTFDFGTIVNLPDGVDDANDRIVMQVVGRVADVADNADGDLLVNTASFDFTGGSLSDDADIEVVEPELTISKAMGPVLDAVVRLTITVENTGTAPAYDIGVSDVLQDSVWDSAALSPVSVSSGFLLETAAGPGAGETTVTFSSDPLAVSPAGTIPVGSLVSAVFDIPLAALPPVPNPVTNQADLDQADTLPGSDPAARALPPDSGTAQIGIPDLGVSKSAALLTDADASGDASPGDTLRYTLVISNTGAGDATNVVLDDAPDANTTLSDGSVTTTQGSVTIGNGAGDATVQVAAGTIAATASATVTYDVVIVTPLPAGVTEVVNQAVVTSSELPPVTSDDPNLPGANDPTVVPVNAAPDLAISKDDGGVTAVPGDTVSYTLTYQNAGNQDATGVAITETVPANSTFNAAASTAGWACVPDAGAGSTCTLAIGNVAAGAAAASASFAVDVDNPLAAGVTQLANNASIADDGANGPDPTPDDNDATDTTPVDAVPDLVLNKDDGGITAVPGATVSYTLTYQNVGNQDATAVAITETVPANATFNAAASTAGWACVPDSGAGSTCTLAIGNVAAGAAAGSASFAVDVDSPLAAGVTQLANSASIADDGANGPDPTPDDNDAGDTTPVDAAPDLVLGKNDGGVTAVPGDTVSYTLTYQNVGNQNATGVAITETVPANAAFNAAASTAGWACLPDAGAGSTCTLAIGALAVTASAATATFAVDVDNPLPAGVEELSNGASIADDGANGPDPTPTNNDDGDTTPLEAAPDLTLGKDDGGVTVVPGDTVSYTLTYQNVGNQDATGAVITETVPLGTTFDGGASTPGWVCAPDGSAGSVCTLAIGAVAAGAAAASAVFAVLVDNPLQAGVDALTNGAGIADDGANGPDPTPEDNDDGDTTPVDATPDLTLAKDDGGAMAVPGDTVSYTLTYQNVGNQDATGAVITETVPVGTTFNSGASSPGWSCVPDGNAGSVCTLAIGAVAAGAPAAGVSFAVDVDSPLQAGVDEIVNGAGIADDGTNGPDPTPDDNGDGDTTPVDAVPDLTISKDDGGVTALPGDTLSYTLSYQNVGTQDATGVVITETVPNGTTFNAGASTPGWTCAPDANAGSTCTLAVGAVAAGAASASAIFAVDVDNPWPIGATEIVNVVSIADDGSNGPDPTPDNNDASVATPVGGPAYFRVTKRFTDGNPAEVEVTIRCDTGLPLTQSATISDGDPVKFVVTTFVPGEMSCDIEERAPAGYAPTYEAYATEDGFAASISSDADGCRFEGVGFGDLVCDIVNTPEPVSVEIEKQWFFGGKDGSGIDTSYRLTLYCDGEIVDGGADCGLPAQNRFGLGAGASDGWCKSFLGYASAVFTAQVIPDYPDTNCHVVEDVFDSAVETENDCQDLTVRAGQGASCVIVNTVFFEGIPTLGPLGLAVLALLMLGTGLIGFRRML